MSQRTSLHPHPAAADPPILTIEVEAGRSGGRLSLVYLVYGEVGKLLLSPPGPSDRTDGLWRHSCFEAFVRGGEGADYAEFNFAPSTAWAAYRFDGPRVGMRPVEIESVPIKVFSGARTIVLGCSVDLDSLGLRDAPLRLNLAAVIEDKDGHTSHWALAHPPEGPPDFHHPDCFVLQLPPAPAP